MFIESIVCVNKEWGIGYKNKLLYHIPEDMKFFKEKTKDSIVVMGRKTFESLPNKKPLDNRVNIVLTKDKNFKAVGVYVANSKEELFDIINKKFYNICNKRIFVIGGENIYGQFLNDISRIYVTKVFDDSKKADVYFPNLDKNNFKIYFRGSIKKYKDIEYTFLEYKSR